MIQIDDLVTELCPNGVEFRKIKDVYRRLKGTPITAGKMKEIDDPTGAVRVFAGGRTVINANEADIPNANITKVPAVLVQSRGVIDAIFYEKPFTFKNEMWAYTSDDISSVKYLYYVLKNNVQYFRDAASGMGSLPQISLKVTENFVIPFPPLEVQKEVVNILDTFTQLEAELSAELSARRKQYEHYRNQLLSFDGPKREIEWSTLGEICNIIRGKRLVKKELEVDGKYPVYQNSMTPLGYYEKSNFSADTTFIISAGAAGEIGYSHTEFWAADDVYILQTPDDLMSRFLYHVLLNQKQLLATKVRRASIPRLSRTAVEILNIPIPPLAEQKRIVGILDKFDRLTTDISEGIPAEINARRKQYEYYRNKLLVFRELQSV